MTEAVRRHSGSGVHGTGAAAADLFDQQPDLTEYICHWSRRIGCIYVETPKVACTTIKRVLQAAELGRSGGTKCPTTSMRAPPPRFFARARPEGFVSALWDTATFRFAFVRNPYSRALSCWLDKMVATTSSASAWRRCSGWTPIPRQPCEFLAAIAAQPETRARPPLGHPDPPAEPPRHPLHFIGRFEHFAGVLAASAAHLGSKPRRGPPRHLACHRCQAPRSKPYRDHEAA
jgi:hypothetical protein